MLKSITVKGSARQNAHREHQMTLKQLKPGQQGVVENILGGGAIRQRLFDMGVTPGAQVLMRRAAPLGDPVQIRIRGYELSLRKHEAEAILVRERA